MDRRRWSAAGLVLAVAVLVPGSPAVGHPALDVVAVPAGVQAGVALRLDGGCPGSSTVSVTVRVPVLGAAAQPVAGWSASSTDDEDGAVLSWVGGPLAEGEPGRFPFTFAVPARPGEVLALPAVQGCADGRQQVWGGGGTGPAPRLLVLPGGSSPAADVAAVPPGTPGREQLDPDLDGDHGHGDDAPGAGGAAGGAGGAGGAAVGGGDRDGAAGSGEDGPGGGAATGGAEPGAAGGAGGAGGDGAGVAAGAGAGGAGAAGAGGEQAAGEGGEGPGAGALGAAVAAAVAVAAVAVAAGRRRRRSA